MNAIWKYEIPLVGRPVVQMPKGARPLAVREQQGALCVWMAVDPQADMVPHPFRVVGTGHPVGMPLASLHVFHVDTVLMSDGLVWHVFDECEVDIASN